MVVVVETIIQNTFIQVVGVSSTDHTSLKRQNYSCMHPLCRWTTHKQAVGLWASPKYRTYYLFRKQNHVCFSLSGFQKSEAPVKNIIYYHDRSNT
jgi:hypothetical protein